MNLPQSFPTRHAALLTAVLATLMSACATQEPPTLGAVASPQAMVTAPDYRAVRASELLGRMVRDQRGQIMGEVQDLIIQMGNGAVRYAVVGSGGASRRFHALPVHAIRTGASNEITLDIARPALTDHTAWTTWPDMLDIAYWREVDRASGFRPIEHGHGYDRFTQLRGKRVVDARGVILGRVEDLVINTTTDTVHYAVVGLESSAPGGARLVAVPVHGFGLPREGANRLALTIDAVRVAQLETFDAARWARLNDPTYVAQVERYFVSAFPQATAPLFDKLDTNRDGFLSRAELSPLQIAGSDRYSVHGPMREAQMFHSFDRDGDGFLNVREASGLLSQVPGASFERYDSNRDGFLSMGEAASLLSTPAIAQNAGVTFDQLDRDRDGFVSRAEASALMPHPAMMGREIAVRPVVTFEALDMDRDGYLNRAEAASLLERMGGAPVFDRYDANRDGFLSRTELDSLLRQEASGGTPGQAGQGALRR